MSSAPGVQETAVASVEVLRSLAHELRQPLGTIESIAYYLSMVSPSNDQRMHGQLLRLRQLVEQSNWILTSGLQLADLPAAAPEPIDFRELIMHTASARTVSTDIPLRLDLAHDLPPVRLDPALGRALVENLLTLFRQLATEACPITLRTSADSGRGVLLEIATRAPGFWSEASLGAGTALSLASARRIAEMHGGALDCTVDPESGIRLCVVLP